MVFILCQHVIRVCLVVYYDKACQIPRLGLTTQARNHTLVSNIIVNAVVCRVSKMPRGAHNAICAE